MPFEPETEERVRLCLMRQGRLTLGEIGVLRSLARRERVPLTFVEEQELRHIERKLKIEASLR
ncbi:MAG: hypothetical protein V1798_10840 [Pseudomonadota bacterium]